MKKLFYAFLVFSVSMPLFSCVRYMEKVTPPGAVPPPPEIQAPIVKDLERSFEPLITDAGAQGSIIKTSTDTIQDFQGMYRKAGKPKIAIFLNRVLSDDVREWKTSDRTIKSHVMEKRGKSKIVVKGPFVDFTQEHIEDDGARVNPKEDYSWFFENGFMNLFLESGAVLVDRATIMRIQAFQDGKQGIAKELIVVKKVEMKALIGKADLFVEVLIRRSKNSPGGYLMKATAKDVLTGRIVASANNKSRVDNKITSRKTLASASGYEVVDVRTQTVKGVGKTAENLALNLMDSFSNTWRLDK